MDMSRDEFVPWHMRQQENHECPHRRDPEETWRGWFVLHETLPPSRPPFVSNPKG